MLSFLVTNRSIPTDDFVRDEQAAVATRDTISKLLVLELATLPSSSDGGFTYRLEPALGMVVRTERQLRSVVHRAIAGGRSRPRVVRRQLSHDDVRGPSTAAVSRRHAGLDREHLPGESTPFDIETMSLRIRTDSMTLNGSVSITDRFDVSAGIPFIRLTLQGERVDIYRGQPLLQATGVGVGVRDLATSWSGPGTTCCVAAPAESRSAARPACRPDEKRTCSAPGAPASRLA